MRRPKQWATAATSSATPNLSSELFACNHPCNTRQLTEPLPGRYLVRDEVKCLIESHHPRFRKRHVM